MTSGRLPRRGLLGKVWQKDGGGERIDGLREDCRLGVPPSPLPVGLSVTCTDGSVEYLVEDVTHGLP